MTSTWAETIAAELSQLDDPAAEPKFTALCDEQIKCLDKQGKSGADIDALKISLRQVGRWLVGHDSIDDALAALSTIAGYPAEICPDCIPVSIIHRLPSEARPAPLVLELAFQTRRKSVVQALLDGRHISEDLLQQVAKKDLRRFVSSRIPEALPDESPCWAIKGVWDTVAEALRGQTEKPVVEALSRSYVRCYLASKDKHAEERLWQFLASAATDVAPRIIDQLLKQPEASYRCTASMASALLARPVLDHDSPVHAAALRIGQRAAALIEQGLPFTAVPAGHAIVLLAAAYAIPGSGVRSRYAEEHETFKAICAPLPAAVRRLAGTPAGPTPVFATGDQIEQCTPRPKARAKGEPSDDVVAQKSNSESLAGVSDFLADIADALYSGETTEGLEQRLEAILSNRGVKTFGVVGETVAFDSQRHSTTDTGVFPNDLMKVVRQGREITIRGVSRVLSKAQVTSTETGNRF